MKRRECRRGFSVSNDTRKFSEERELSIIKDGYDCAISKHNTQILAAILLIRGACLSYPHQLRDQARKMSRTFGGTLLCVQRRIDLGD